MIAPRPTSRKAAHKSILAVSKLAPPPVARNVRDLANFGHVRFPKNQKWRKVVRLTHHTNPGSQSMNNNKTAPALALGIFIMLGLAALGWQLGNSVIRFKEYERTVTVKGLSEREYPADIVIWPIQFTEAGNELGAVYGQVENNVTRIRDYLRKAGIPNEEISVSTPAITDKSAQNWGDGNAQLRYLAMQTVTVYSEDVPRVRAAMGGLAELGKQGIAFNGDMYQNQVEYLFTRLNDVKPEMIEEATTAAREIGEKFAEDSRSRLGKIRTASQGQFSIESRDTNNPHIK
jgi:hypothetical protein